jgi:hypothetical protein
VTEYETIDAVFAGLREQLATCADCWVAREVRRDSGRELQLLLVECFLAGDLTSSCPDCVAAQVQYHAMALREIFTLGAHPHHVGDGSGS